MQRKPYFLVICKRGDTYVLATPRQFPTQTAAELYTMTLGAVREPLVVRVD